MKSIKKYGYFVLLLSVGLLYLQFADHWQVYRKPMEQIQIWLQQQGIIAAGSTTESNSTRVTPAQQVQETNSSDSLEGNASKQEAREEPTEGNQIVPVDQQTFSTYMTVEDDYFKDALFIGDSRTVGMQDYGELQDIATFYTSTGLTIYKIFDSQIVKVPGASGKITIEEALSNQAFSKIYLMIGINEMGTGTVDSFIEKYGEVLAHLRELQPDAIIYVQAIMKVTTRRSNRGDYINNEGIDARNERLQEFADQKKIFYLDVNPELVDESGVLIEDYTFDGVHLKAKYYAIWKDFLKTHAIDFTKPDPA